MPEYKLKAKQLFHITLICPIWQMKMAQLLTVLWPVGCGKRNKGAKYLGELTLNGLWHYSTG